jgi:hypothetical protein
MKVIYAQNVKRDTCIFGVLNLKHPMVDLTNLSAKELAFNVIGVVLNGIAFRGLLHIGTP